MKFAFADEYDVYIHYQLTCANKNYCRYLSEPTRRGGSNVYQQYLF